jgi:AcrR family transcriptional regulator
MDLILRKTPRQARSCATVATILDAAARVLTAEGLARATTNRIAEVAGISVGSLYQYFPNKLAIVGALQIAHGRAMVELTTHIKPAATNLSLEKTVRLLTDSILDGHLAIERLHREIVSSGSSALVAGAVRDIREQIVRDVREMFVGHDDMIVAPSLDLAAAFTFQIVMTLTHAAVDEPQRFPPTVVGNEMPRMIVRYLVAESRTNEARGRRPES